MKYFKIMVKARDGRKYLEATCTEATLAFTLGKIKAVNPTKEVVAVEDLAYPAPTEGSTFRSLTSGVCFAMEDGHVDARFKEKCDES